MMGNYEQLKAAVASIVRDNGAEEITGNVLQSVLISIINSVGSGAVFAGIATPSTSPSNPDPNMFYIAVEAGTYPNFNLTVTTGMCIFSNESGTWVGHELNVSSQFNSGEYITEVSITDTLEGAETDNLPTVGAINGAVTALNTAITTERHDRQEADGNQTVALNLEKTLRQQGDEANSASVGYFVCDTAAATAAKVVNASGYVLRIGGNIRIEMTNANTADNATLNINGTGAKSLFYNGTQASHSNSWKAGEIIEVYYDGTQYQCASVGGGEFATGEKVRETGIADTQTDGSKDAFSSGGAAELSKTLAWILGNMQTAIQKTNGNKIGEDEALVLAHALCELNSNGGGGSSGGDYTPQGAITIATSDTMVIFGSSFGIGYTTAGKHWVDILNQFSDYSIQNLSADGQSNLTRLIALRNGNISPAPSARFALIVNSENMGQDVSVVYQSFINLAHAVKSYGMQPIIGTSYRNIAGFRQCHQYFSSLLRRWCDENNTIFMDAGEYNTVTNHGYNGGNTHLGDRQIPLVAYAYMRALRGLEKPRQSMKVYKVRDGFAYSSLDDLMFMDNYERARKFFPVAATTTFSNYALYSVVLPASVNTLSMVSLTFDSEQAVKVYTMDVDAAPYPTTTTYTRFHVDVECVAIVGDTYTYNGTTFTVVYVESGDARYGAFCDIYCSPNLGTTSDTGGTLVRASGSGSAQIVFASYGNAALSQSELVMGEIGGHWVEVDGDNNGEYFVTPKTSVLFDKLHLLFEYSGSFSISNVVVRWKATMEKNAIRTPIPQFTSNEFNPNTEIIAESTFGDGTAALTTWTDKNGNYITPSVSTYLPSGCSSVIAVSDTDYMRCVINKTNFHNGKAVIEVLAQNNQETISSESWDWNKLYVRLDQGNNNNPLTIYSEPVGLAWKIVRFPIEIIGLVDGFFNMGIQIYSERDGMLISKVSLKYI